MLTDGFEEAVNLEGDYFGVERTLKVVRDNPSRPAREIVEALFKALRAFSQNAPQGDDLTAVVIKSIGLPTAGPG